MSKKKYIIISVVVILISIIALIGTSYALLTMTLEGDKKITLTAGILRVDFTDSNYINLDNTAPTSDSKGQSTTPYTFTITNTGNIDAYYHISLEEDSANTLSNTYLKMRLTNDKGYDSGIVNVSGYGSGTFEIKGEEVLSPSDKVTYRLWMWLSDDADNSAQGKEYKSKIIVNSYDREQGITVSNALLNNIGDGSLYDDGEDTYVTGKAPNNYIWYSGKLWRAVSIDSSDNSVKIITDDTITTIPYGKEESGDYSSSNVKTWLNDTSDSGFLGNLRNYESFLKTDSTWQARSSSGNINSADQTVTAPVGLLTEYEFTVSYRGASSNTGYLYNSIEWWLLSSSSSLPVYVYRSRGMIMTTTTEGYSVGVRPVVNLKSNVTVVSGSGTALDPYRLAGDNDTNLTGTYLKDRYSGEYVSFGTGENNLYRIVSHEDEGTRMTTSVPLTSNGTPITTAFNSSSAWNPAAYYENGASILYNYIHTTYQNTMLTSEQREMLSPMNLYMGTVGPYDSYLLAKYTDENKTSTNNLYEAHETGVLRLGELMTGLSSNTDGSYWLLTNYDYSNVRTIEYGSMGGNLFYTSPTQTKGIKPVVNLNANVIITAGTGVKSDPFEVSFES